MRPNIPASIKRPSEQGRLADVLRILLRPRVNVKDVPAQTNESCQLLEFLAFDIIDRLFERCDKSLRLSQGIFGQLEF